MNEQPAAPTTASGAPEESFGQNAWIVEEMHQQFLANPASVDDTWRAYFAESNGSTKTTNGSRPVLDATAVIVERPQLAVPTANGNGSTNGDRVIAANAVATPVPVPVPAPAPAAAAPVEGSEEATALRGAAARIVENMVTSLGVPTATSAHPLPAKLLEVNRRLINEHLDRVGGGKVSFTHLIAYAIVKALGDVPALNSTFVDNFDGKGTPGVIRHEHVNLGIAIDLERPGGSRSLVVPAVKAADTLDFRGFVAAYEDLVSRARSSKLAVEDFQGVTVTVTNPGTLGTTQSVPRLMSGQGAIIGVGALDFPVEFAGADQAALAALGIGKVLTLTSTYDHRIIQGAESGLFLKRAHELLVDVAFYEEIFAELGVTEPPARWQRMASSAPAASSEGSRVAIRQLIAAYRLHGHLGAWIDPLAGQAPSTPDVLDPATYGLSVWDLDKSYPTEGLLQQATAPLGAIVAALRRAYSSSFGVEFEHIQDSAQRHFIADAVEAEAAPLSPDEQRYVLERLYAAEALERFAQTRYPAVRRFSLEGSESTIPFIDAVLELAATGGVNDVVIGMAHRGRLNVLANVLGKPYSEILQEFEDNLDPLTVEGYGDLKYHKGGAGKWVGRTGASLPVVMPPNPSHLEAVNPVALGVVRAKQDRSGAADQFPILSVLIHGDASFAGQGVVAESLNLSQVAGYAVGGTMHLIINNQIGFTTNPVDARSTRYCTDLAKAIEAPIFHVNGDDPEAVVRVARLAEAYRAKFHRDVVVDLVSYRRMGHNEQDDPSYTQPLMYQVIDAHPTTYTLYAKKLVAEGVLSGEDVAGDRATYDGRLTTALEEARAIPHPHFDVLPPRPVRDVPSLALADGVARETLDKLARRLHTWPAGFGVHPKLERQLLQRAEQYDAGEVDWALGEALAYGSLLLEGTDIRLTGQDARRGTFSHRQSVLINVNDGSTYTPLLSLTESVNDAPALGEVSSIGSFEVYDSVLSEYAAMGFEYGYSVEANDALVMWEAQFGDFANGAQIVIDNFLVAGEEKWGQYASLVLLLPHGYEGQGAEHSSARVERFLQLSAEGNITVVQPTNAGQLFHLLRAHAHQAQRRPLVVITPKSLLRARTSRTRVDDLVSGHFNEVLDDPGAGSDFDRQAVKRVVLCSGKIAFELLERNRKIQKAQPSAAPVAVVRVEQLHPWPEQALREVLASYPLLSEIVWAQDEPENMGSWTYVDANVGSLLNGASLSVVARAKSGTTATGSHTLHALEVASLSERAVGPEPVA